jgi:hypothetical protein
LEVFKRRLSALAVARDKNDARALLRQPVGGDFPDAGRSPRYDDRFQILLRYGVVRGAR